jgi:hypothetical protein
MFIPDPGFEFFHPRSRVKKIPDLNPHDRILSILTQKTVSKLSEKWSGMLIPDPDPDFFPIPDPDPGSSDKKALDPGSGSVKLVVLGAGTGIDSYV